MLCSELSSIDPSILTLLALILKQESFQVLERFGVSGKGYFPSTEGKSVNSPKLLYDEDHGGRFFKKLKTPSFPTQWTVVKSI